MATPTARPVRPTATPTAATVEPPTEEIDEEEAIPLGEMTAEPEEEAVEPTPMPTVTLLPTVEVPTQEALETPAAAPQEEAEPMRVIGLIADQLQGPPMVVLESAGEVYVPLAVSYCWDDAAGERECPPDQVIDYPSERLVVPPFGAFLVVTDDPVPKTVDFVILAADASAELARETRAGATLILYTPLIEEQGSYLFAVEAEWPEGNATYYFLLLILEPEALTPPG